MYFTDFWMQEFSGTLIKAIMRKKKTRIYVVLSSNKMSRKAVMVSEFIFS